MYNVYILRTVDTETLIVYGPALSVVFYRMDRKEAHLHEKEERDYNFGLQKGRNQRGITEVDRQNNLIIKWTENIKSNHLHNKTSVSSKTNYKILNVHLY